MSPSSSLTTESAAPSHGDVDAFIQLPADQAVLLYAESVLTARCMEAAGFTYEALDYSVVLERMQQSAVDARRNQFPYSASVEGVPYAHRTEGAPFDPNETYIPSLDEVAQVAYGDALQGQISDRIEVTVLGSTAATPRGGCISEARSALYGSLEDALSSLILSGNLSPATHTRARSDPAVVEAMASWAQCMTGVGFQFADFGAARTAAATRPDDAERIAGADDECTAKVGLGTAYADAFERARSSVIDANIGQFEATWTARSHAVATAQQLLVEG